MECVILRLVSALCFFLVALASPADPVAARAGATESFLNALGEARMLVRATTRDLRGGKAEEAETSLRRLSGLWADMTARFRASPPWPFERIGSFADVLDGSLRRMEKAAAALQDGKPELAIDELGPLRREWASLRKAAGFYGLGECLDDASEALNAFLAVRRGPTDMNRGEVRGDISGRAAVYRYSLKRCEPYVAVDGVIDGDYARTVDAINAALDVVATAVRLRDLALLDRILNDLKGLDLQLAMRYG